jgi:hypothetical protein
VDLVQYDMAVHMFGLITFKSLDDSDVYYQYGYPENTMDTAAAEWKMGNKGCGIFKFLEQTKILLPAISRNYILIFFYSTGTRSIWQGNNSK